VFHLAGIVANWSGHRPNVNTSPLPSITPLGP